MLIGIHDAEMPYSNSKTKFPNYALMKISAYHKSIGDTVEWFIPLASYDKVYSSKVFEFTPEDPALPPDTIRGDTGITITIPFPMRLTKCFRIIRYIPNVITLSDSSREDVFGIARGAGCGKRRVYTSVSHMV